MIKRWIILFVFLLLCCATASAHQDKIIKHVDGKLIGLPNEYQPAYFDDDTKTLQVAGNILRFPECVCKYFPEDNKYDIQFTSSWYHDLTRLPPYLLISIHPKDKYHSYHLLFDMTNLNPIQFEVRIRESVKLMDHHNVEISGMCKESIRRNIEKST